MGCERDPQGVLTETLAEVEMLREELRLCRLELAKVREDDESLRAGQAKQRRARIRAQKESAILAKTLSDVLYARTREQAGKPWWKRGGRGVSREEWQQVQTLRQSGIFRPAWYLRRNLSVAKLGIDPALHFLREGNREGRDPGPHFDLPAYLDKHPEVRRSGENALLHALESGELPAARGASSTG